MSQEEKPNKAKNNALAIYNEKRRNGEIKPPKKLSKAFRDMQNDALVVIEKSLKGSSDVTKAQVDTAWKVINSVMTTERAEQDKIIRELTTKIKEIEAQDKGAILPKQEQVKEQREKEGLKVLEGGHFQYNPEWDEEDELEEDLDDDNN